jgi:Domain of unknown function (DUF4426)
VSAARRHAALLALALLPLLPACGGGNAPPPPARSWTDPGYVEQGTYVLSYSAQPTVDLAPAIAAAYGIGARTDRAVVVVSLTRDGRATDGTEQVTVSARTLSGVSREIQLRKATHAGVVAWIGELTVAHRELLLFEVQARPAGDPVAINAAFQREFFTE